MSPKPLALSCYPFITLLWRDICDKMEHREWENEAECSYCGRRPWRYQSFLWFTLSSQHTWVFHQATPGERCSAVTERRVSETPWQVGRHKDSPLLIIDGNKLHSLDVWQGNTWWMRIQMCLWMYECEECMSVCVCVCVCVCACVQREKKRVINNSTEQNRGVREN